MEDFTLYDHKCSQTLPLNVEDFRDRFGKLIPCSPRKNIMPLYVEDFITDGDSTRKEIHNKIYSGRNPSKKVDDARKHVDDTGTRPRGGTLRYPDPQPNQVNKKGQQ